MANKDIIARAQIGALDRRLTETIAATERATGIAYSAAKEAVAKADAATEKRLDAMNEFRSAMSEQASRLITRAEVEAIFAGRRAIGESLWRVTTALLALLIAASGFFLALARG